jgi:hypothetical protein
MGKLNSRHCCRVEVTQFGLLASLDVPANDLFLAFTARNQVLAVRTKACLEDHTSIAHFNIYLSPKFVFWFAVK